MKRHGSFVAMAVLLGLAVLLPQLAETFEQKYAAIPGDAGLGAVIVEGDHPEAFLTSTSPNRVLAGILGMGFTGEIRFSPGIYPFGSGVEIEHDGVRIQVDPGAKLIPADSGDIGLFKFTGDRCELAGGGLIEIQDAVDNQVIVELRESHFSKIRDLHWDMTTSSGSSAAPVTLFKTVQCLSPRITGNDILPNRGMLVFHIVLGHGGFFDDNIIRNESLVGAGGDDEPPATLDGSGWYTNWEPRECYAVFKFDGAQWFDCRGNMMWGLGTPTNPVEHFIYFNKITFETALDGGSASYILGEPFEGDGGSFGVNQTEQGHFSITGNVMELCRAKSRGIEVYGAQWPAIQNNRFGWGMNGPRNLGDAAIYLGGRLGDTNEEEYAASGTALSGVMEEKPNDPVTQAIVAGNLLHNFGAVHTPPLGGGDDSLACSIYLSYCRATQIDTNMLGTQYSVASILIDFDRAQKVDINNCKGRSNAETSTPTAQYMIASAGGTQAADLVVRNCTANNYVMGVIQPGIGNPGAGFQGLAYSGLEAYTKTFTTLTFDRDTSRISDSGNGLHHFPVGTFVHVTNGGDTYENTDTIFWDSGSLDTIEDTDDGLDLFAVGDFIWVTGSDTDSNNYVIREVLTVASDGSSMTVAPSFAAADDAVKTPTPQNQTKTIRKIGHSTEGIYLVTELAADGSYITVFPPPNTVATAGGSFTLRALGTNMHRDED